VDLLLALVLQAPELGREPGLLNVALVLGGDLCTIILQLAPAVVQLDQHLSLFDLLTFLHQDFHDGTVSRCPEHGPGHRLEHAQWLRLIQSAGGGAFTGCGGLCRSRDQRPHGQPR